MLLQIIQRFTNKTKVLSKSWKAIPVKDYIKDLVQSINILWQIHPRSRHQY